MRLFRTTEKLEEQRAELLPGARIARLAADNALGKGQPESCPAEVHAGDVNVLVGRQKVITRHDIPAHHAGGGGKRRERAVRQRILRARASLCAADAGQRQRQTRRRGRCAQRDVGADLASPIALVRFLETHCLSAFAGSQLDERRSAGLMPYSPLVPALAW